MQQFSTRSSISSSFDVLPNTTIFQTATNPLKTIEGFQVPDVLHEDGTILVAVLSSSCRFHHKATDSTNMYDAKEESICTILP